MKVMLKYAAILIALGVLITAASAFQGKTYKVTLPNACRVGTVELAAGEYKLVVDAPKVRFIETRTGKETEVDAKIADDAEDKFDNTEIHSSQADGTNQLIEIRIAGTRVKIAFR